MLNDLGDPIWTIIDGDTLELDGDYSGMQTNIQIVKTIVGRA